MMQEFICYILIFTAEAITAWLYFEYLFESKTSTWIRNLTIFLGYAVMFAFFQLNSIPLNAFLTVAMNAALVLLNYRCKLKSAILHGAFLTFCMTGIEVLVNLLIVATGIDFAAFTYDTDVLNVMAIVSKLFYLAVVLIAARFFMARTRTDSEPHLIALFCSMPLISVLIALIITWLGFSFEMNRSSRIMMMLTVFSLLIINLLFLTLYRYLQKAQQEQVSLELSLQKEQADTAYYQALQEQYKSQRILIHDIKNHLSTISNLAYDGNQDDIISYIGTLQSEVLPAANTRYCDEPILNMMLLRYATDCKKHNIELECDVRANTVSFMDPASITTLYGNLLSNAIEAAAAVPNAQIEVSVTQNSETSFVILSVINSSKPVQLPDDAANLPITKKCGTYHGIGLKSIRRIVNKYHGVSAMYYNAEEQKFHHVIQFPLILEKD